MQSYKLINRGRGKYKKYPRLLDFGRGAVTKNILFTRHVVMTGT
jgi:hypothetical protein